MAEPIDFKEANFTWKGWPASKTEPEVLDLPVWKKDGRSISCWKMTPLERILILFTGKTWASVRGNQPPILVEGRYPFIKPSAETSIAGGFTAVE